MPNAIPILILLIGAAIGAAVMTYFFRQLGYRPLIGAAAGATGGAVGALLFTLPLNFCMFAPPENALYEVDSIDNVFGVILIAIGLLIVLGSIFAVTRWWSNRSKTQVTAEGVHEPGAFKARWLAAVLLAPTLIILALFLYYPSIDTVRLSTLLAKLGSQKTIFVCVDNYTNVFTDPKYIQSIGTTIFMSLAIVVIGMSLSLMIATMAYQPIKGARIYRILLIWPYAISPAVAGIIFVLMFNPVGGVINHFMDDLLGLNIGWLNDPTAAPWTVIIASVWKSMGFNILFYIAGLQNVPKDLQESAAIDGANALQRFRHIVIPLLSPITFFLVITNLTYAFFETFATINKLTPGGGPLQSTTTLMYRVYQVGVAQSDLGKGAAQSIILFVMVVGVTLYQFRTSGSRVNYGA